MDAFLLAGGTSGRILSITKGKPKPLIKIKKKTLLERNLKWIMSYGIHNIWINLHFKPNMIKEEIKKINPESKINFSFEKKLLGTAGAIKKVEKKLSQNFLVIYCDNLLSFNLNNFIDFHLKKKSDISIALYSPKRHYFSGIASSEVILSKNSKIKSFIEGKEKLKKINKLVNTGTYLLNKKILKKIPVNKFFDFSLNLFPQFINKKFYGYKIEKKGYCLASDTPETYKKTVEIVKKEKLF